MMLSRTLLMYNNYLCTKSHVLSQINMELGNLGKLISETCERSPG